MKYSNFFGGSYHPVKQRPLLYDLGKGSINEVAEKMDVKKETVSRYICTGLKKIRQILKKKQGDYNGYFKF